jgi:sulfhydrogenase subunit beta (sulfur reductase)
LISIRTTKSAFLEGLRSLLGTWSVLAPSYIDGRLDYIWISDPEQVALDDELPYKSPKEAVFPRVEKILTITGDGAFDGDEIRPMLIIGVKPCDITAFRLLDEVFIGEKTRFSDVYYKRRREKLVVVGMGCREKKRGCFCTERGIDMSYSAESDAFITLDGDSMIIHINNDSLETLFDVVGGEKANGETLSGSSLAASTLEIGTDESEIFDSMPWEKYVEGCIGCGTCTYICPTCHCFEFKDTEVNGAVSRYRCWDSCMYPKFTLHASGHNPRSTKAERFRQRVMHKYVYLPKNVGLTACTGCGRCIRSCPGGINIRKAVEDINARTGRSLAGKGRSE